MAAITPQMVKELRDKTDAGMGECKKALIEANGDIEAAVDILRKAGIAKSAHRADRATAEGKIFVAVDGNQALMLEVCCETDFVANNEKFLEYGNGAAKKILANTTGDGDVTEAARKSEETELAALFSKFGEKMIIRRALRFPVVGKDEERGRSRGNYIAGGADEENAPRRLGKAADEDRRRRAARGRAPRRPDEFPVFPRGPQDRRAEIKIH